MNEKRKLIHSLVFPFFFIIVIWFIKLTEILSGTSLAFLGIYPLKAKGLIGIITAPLIHGDINHLVNNTVPFLVLSIATFYFYRPLGYKIFFLTWIITGIWVWCGGRDAYHIGASGIVYGLASFLFFSGAIRRIPGLAAVSLIVVFLYGSMIWGIFPFIPDVSWESHLSGGIAGIILAVLYRHDGPQPKKYEWEELTEEDIREENEDKINEFLDGLKRPSKKIKYFNKPDDKSKKVNNDKEDIREES
jgi:membrane associated rhomboid family serine protease